MVKHRVIPTEPERLTDIAPGMWVRASKYSQSHLVSRNGEDAVCGRPLRPDLHEWIAEDDQTPKCARCKGRDVS